ncbi:hypothetical protein CKF58_03310 [Psittacicella hinzii]|uniref:GAF domain-containing protein n=2 Tax=Psittacicella hinzii TaxID=2028575 RepID=A0A3A1YMC8_9GAMM|nr:hypothetical protein CKF58_03310 [Psittacicella hinzii]
MTQASQADVERLLATVDLSSLNSNYRILVKQAANFAAAETNLTSLLSNIAALIYSSLKDLNWAGFYLTHVPENTLYLGPFQGKTACNRIAWGKGVCGTAAATQTTQRIANVHEFPGHIACDSASNSELVIPMLVEQQVIGVLDLDSPLFERFSAEDQVGLEALITVLSARLATLDPVQFAAYR